jgi:hypothetical protein
VYPNSWQKNAEDKISSYPTQEDQGFPSKWCHACSLLVSSRKVACTSSQAKWIQEQINTGFVHGLLQMRYSHEQQ